MLTERHTKLLADRGLDVELLARLGVESLPKRDGEWIAIPYLRGGQVVSHKFRTIAGEKRFYREADAPQVFWNVDTVTDASLAAYPLIVTEGELDAISALQAGFPRVVSVPDGAPAHSIGIDQHTAKYRFIEDLLPALKECREIVICADADAAGANLLHDLVTRLGKSRCKWVKYPKGCKDLNDALRLFGERGVTETINRAQWVRISGLYRMSDLPPAPERTAFVIPGLPGLERHYRMRLGDFCVITGIPSFGKTTFTNDIACRMATHYGWTVTMASLEQHPQYDHRRALRTRHAGRLEKDMSPAEIAEADAWIDRHFVFMHPTDDDDLVNLEWIAERCAVAAVRYGAKLIVIDPWNEIDHDRPPDMTIAEYTGFAIKQLKRIAQRYMVHLIVVAHPTKLKREHGKIPVPSLYDVSDAAHWANKADVGIVVHRENVVDNSETVIKVVKSRYHDDIGVPGQVTLRWYRDLGRFGVDDAVQEDMLA